MVRIGLTSCYVMMRLRYLEGERLVRRGSASTAYVCANQDNMDQMDHDGAPRIVRQHIKVSTSSFEIARAAG